MENFPFIEILGVFAIYLAISFYLNKKLGIKIKRRGFLSMHRNRYFLAIDFLFIFLFIVLSTMTFIDEVQFFDWTVAELCDQLADQGLRVILAGLDMDFRGEPFGPMPILLAQAEEVSKLHAICVICGEEASRTQRLVDNHPARYDDPVVIVGASELYEARCRKHHEVPQ